jgi:ABC-2 type transport system ATP-binding protein
MPHAFGAIALAARGFSTRPRAGRIRRVGRQDDAQSDFIRAEGLSKRYGSRRGIEALDLTVGRGEAFGLLGPNGAGKTTALRLLTGFLRPSAGRATIAGLDCWRQRRRVLELIGYVPGHVRLYEHMRAWGLIKLIDRLHGGGHLWRAGELAERLRFDPTLAIHEYSRGNKQKLAVITALMHRPRLLVLDEPTTSLDPIIADEVHGLLEEAREGGATLLLSSHALGEVERVCRRVGVLRDGRLIAVEPIERFRHNHLRRLTVTFDGPPPADAAPGLTRLGGCNGHTVEYAVTGELAAALRWLAGQNVADLEIAWPRMEEVFLGYYRDTPASTPPAQGRGEDT